MSPIDVLNNATALSVLLKLVEVEVDSVAIELSTLTNELLNTVEVEVLKDATELSKLTKLVDVEVDNEATELFTGVRSVCPPLNTSELIAVDVDVLKYKTALSTVLKLVEVEVDSKAIELSIALNEPLKLVEVEVLNEATALFTLLKPVEVEVDNKATELSTALKAVEFEVDKEATALFTLLVEPLNALLIAVEVEVLNDAIELSTLLKPAEVEVLKEATELFTGVRSVCPPLITSELITVDVDVLSDAIAVSTLPKPIEVDVLSDITLLSDGSITPVKSIAFNDTLTGGISLPVWFVSTTLAKLSSFIVIDDIITPSGIVSPFVMPIAAPLSFNKTIFPFVNGTSNTDSSPLLIGSLSAVPIKVTAPDAVDATHLPLTDSLVCSMIYTLSATAVDPSSQLKVRFNDSTITWSLLVGTFVVETNNSTVLY